jgi:hypothetical protein
VHHDLCAPHPSASLHRPRRHSAWPSGTSGRRRGESSCCCLSIYLLSFPWISPPRCAAVWCERSAAWTVIVSCLSNRFPHPDLAATLRCRLVRAVGGVDRHRRRNPARSAGQHHKWLYPPAAEGVACTQSRRRAPSQLRTPALEPPQPKHLSHHLTPSIHPPSTAMHHGRRHDRLSAFQLPGRPVDEEPVCPSAN